MQNICTLYRFQFPFLDIRYEKKKTQTFLSNIKDFLLYEELHPRIEQNEKNETLTTYIYFDFWKIESIYYDNNDYFIPIFQCRIYLDPQFPFLWKEKLFHKIYNTNMTFGKDYFIFDIDENYLSHRKDDVISIDDIKKSASMITMKELQNFLDTSQKLPEYVSEYLDTHIHIKYYLYYLIYVCYIFYYHAQQLSLSKKELDSIIGRSHFALYEGNIKFTKEKLQHLENINITVFKKYFEILDWFFKIFKKNNW